MSNQTDRALQVLRAAVANIDAKLDAHVAWQNCFALLKTHIANLEEARQNGDAPVADSKDKADG